MQGIQFCWPSKGKEGEEEAGSRTRHIKLKKVNGDQVMNAWFGL